VGSFIAGNAGVGVAVGVLEGVVAPGLAVMDGTGASSAMQASARAAMSAASPRAIVRARCLTGILPVRTLSRCLRFPDGD